MRILLFLGLLAVSYSLVAENFLYKRYQQEYVINMDPNAKINMTVLIDTELSGKESCRGLYALKNF